MFSSEGSLMDRVPTDYGWGDNVRGDARPGADGNDAYQFAKHHLNIIIVGAGIAGLTLAAILGHCGHKVIVLEAAPVIAEVGAGIYCSPNLTRVLNRWGFDRRIRQHANGL